MAVVHAALIALRDPSAAVAAGPSNIPPPVIHPVGSSERRPAPKKKPNRPKRKRIASEASASVAGESNKGAGGGQVNGQRKGDGEGTVGSAEGDLDDEEEAEVWVAAWLESMPPRAYESKEQRCVVVLDLRDARRR